MPTLRVTVLIDVDDVPLAISPIIRRIAPNEEQDGSITRVTSASYVALPAGELTTAIQMLFVQADQTVSIGVNNSSTNPITLNPNGFLLIVDGNLVGGAPLLQNNSGSTSSIKTLIAGS